MTIQEKFDLTGRVAVVTGGVGLLGAEFCKTLAEAGAAVAVVDMNASASQGTADTLTKSGYKALAVPTDITQPDSVNAMVEKVLSAFGRLDILVNSAALDPKFDPDADEKRNGARRVRGLSARSVERGAECQSHRNVFGHTGMCQTNDRPGEEGQYHQHLLHIWTQWSRPENLYQRWRTCGIQAGLLHSDQRWGNGLHQISRRILCRYRDPRQCVDPRRCVQQSRGIFRKELLRQNDSWDAWQRRMK